MARPQPSLIERMRSGDSAALSEIYRRESPAVYRFALRMSGDPDIASEIVQEAFLALIRRPEGFDPARGALSSYLFGSTRNLLRGRMRGAARTEEIEAEYPEGDPPESPETLDAFEALDRDRRVEGVREVVLTLPGPYREVVVLCDLQERSYAETAEMLGLAVGTVRSRLHRARALLLRKLSQSGAWKEMTLQSQTGGAR